MFSNYVVFFTLRASYRYMSNTSQNKTENAYAFWNRVDKVSNISSKELSLKLEINYRTMLDMRSRCRFPSIENIVRISNILNVSIDWLLTGELYTETEEALYVEQNPDAKLLVRAIMQNPHLLSIISTLLRTDVDKGKDSAM